jgi:hypothetical protein
LSEVEHHQILSGGRTARSVVRVGGTVRRPPALNDEFARALLGHLERQGFDGAPRFLGVDDAGRRIFSFIAGDVPDELGHHDDERLAAAARLIRRYHDATDGLFEAAACREAGLEVACHNDLSPCNTVFRNGRPVALIDFDAAAAGSRAWDLGYASWLWLDLGNQDYALREQLRRLQLFVGAYGQPLCCDEIVAAAVERQGVLIEEGARIGNPGLSDWASTCREVTVCLQGLLAAR